MHDLTARWKGVALTLILTVSIIWLGATGQLGLYINPKSFGFTITMAVIGGALALFTLAFAPAVGRGHEHEHEHEQAHDREVGVRPRAKRRPRFATASALLVITAAGAALLVVPPATLTARTAVARDVGITTADLAGDAPVLAGLDPSGFTIKDWAVIAEQFDDPAEFAATELELTGFVSPAPGDPGDSFYIARFAITHCAIDARPVGVVVHLPGWKERFEVGDWVTGTGRLGADPLDDDGLALLPTAIEPTTEPDQPYVY